MKRIIQIAIVSALFSACADPYVRDSTPALNSQVKPGDVVKVNKEIVIPPYTTAVKFQFTQIVEDSLLTTSNRKYEAVCKILISKRQHKPVVILPQDIRIKGVTSYEDILSIHEKFVGVYIDLESELLPELSRIDCKDFTAAYEDHYFTIGLFEQSFGDYLKIKKK